MHVGDAGDDVALDRVVGTNALDLVLKRAELMPLGFLRHLIEGAEQLIETVVCEPLQDTGRPRNLAPSERNIEPPGKIGGKLGQTPIAELGNQQRFASCSLAISIGEIGRAS